MKPKIVQPAKTPVHYIDPDFLNPSNPLLINLIGVGGTGSRVLSELGDLNKIFISLGHPGFVVRAFDADQVMRHNLGRQRFAQAEEHQNKAEALINRLNRIHGTYWQAYPSFYHLDNLPHLLEMPAQFTISCVDKVKSRFEIAAILKEITNRTKSHAREQPSYWIDFGNSRHTGQVILSTLRPIEQPDSKKFIPIPSLPLFTEEYKTDLEAIDDDNEPSCSMEEALSKQDIYINPALAILGCRLLAQMFREGMTAYRGLFLNLSTYKIVPIPIQVSA